MVMFMLGVGGGGGMAVSRGVGDVVRDEKYRYV